MSETLDKLIPDALLDEYRLKGFVVVPDLLTDEELDRFRPAVEHGVRERKAADTRPLDEKSRYEQSFLQCQNLWEDFPDVRPLTFHPLIGQAAAELIGTDVVRLWHDQALFKEPNGRPTDAHQDQPYWPINEPDTITAWVPLDNSGSTLEGGAMGYVPGSHLVGLRKFVDIFFSDEPYNIIDDPELEGVEPEFVEVPRGGVAFHSGLTVHLAKPNVTDQMRSVHTMIMFADGCTRSNPFPHYSVERYKVEVGAPIDSPATPVVWPRPDGDFPPLPDPMPEELKILSSPGAFPG
jgi:ectoine hydroxylase-related dioxygenase (phytanoyl-CoA dioxygenase family)